MPVGLLVQIAHHGTKHTANHAAQAAAKGAVKQAANHAVKHAAKHAAGLAGHHAAHHAANMALNNPGAIIKAGKQTHQKAMHHHANRLKRSKAKVRAHKKATPPARHKNHKQHSKHKHKHKHKHTHKHKHGAPQKSLPSTPDDWKRILHKLLKPKLLDLLQSEFSEALGYIRQILVPEYISEQKMAMLEGVLAIGLIAAGGPKALHIPINVSNTQIIQFAIERGADGFLPPKDAVRSCICQYVA
jgi:hypothetical protein